MKISIVIPAYDAAETVADTLTSLLAQTHPDWEAVVVDDGSRDATAAIVSGFAERDVRIRLLRQANAGEAGARNTGITAAHHDWLLFLDADDWISPQYLERMTGVLAADPGLDAVHCGYARVAADGSLIVDKYQPPTGDMFDTWARRSAFPVHACIVRKTLVEGVGKFDTSLKKSADWDLWQRVARTGARFGAIREVLAYYRMRPAAASLGAHQMLADGLKVLRQGHAFDPRVPNPHRDHINGSPPEGVQTQEFYLLCWCAGLLLGSGKDARPLLEMLKDEHFPGLYPDAAAQCIFDAAPLSICGAPSAWVQLWPRIQPQVDDFLVALEAQSLAPDLARRSSAAVAALALKASPSWQPAIEEREQSILDQQATIADLRQGKTSMEHELSKIRQLSDEREQTIAAQRARIEELEQGLAESHRERMDWLRRSEEHDRTMMTQRARIEELRQSVAVLQRERTDWQRLSEERERTIVTQLARIEELEQVKSALHRERSEWQRLSAERKQAIATHQTRIEELEKSSGSLDTELADWRRWMHERDTVLERLLGAGWVRAGIRLGIMKPPAETDSRNYDPDGVRAKRWRLHVAEGSVASLVFPPHDPELVRVAIAKATTKTSWDVQLNQPGLNVIAQRPYAVHVRARADEPRNIMVGVAQAHAPWNNLGLYQIIGLTPEWQSFEEPFVASADDDDARIHFDLGGSRIPVELCEVSLRMLSEAEVPTPATSEPLRPESAESMESSRTISSGKQDA